MEEWRAIPGFAGYEVSTLGRVRSLDRVTDRGRKWRGRIMSTPARRDGYHQVTLWREGRQHNYLLHRIVLLTFAGDANGLEALHGDGNRDNNTLANLRWGTRAENIADQLAHGTHHLAARTTCRQGHEYTEENTYRYPGKPHRACRKCRRAWLDAYRQRKSKEVV